MPIGAKKLTDLPQTVNELVADRAIRHALYLERYKTQLVEQILKEFNGTLEPELLAKIEKSLRRISGTSKQLQALFKQNGALVREQYTVMEAKLYSQLTDFTKVESSWLIKTLETATPIAWDFVAPSAGMLKAMVTRQPMEGALVKEWFNKLVEDTAFAVNRQIQMGLIEGEGINDIVRRIKGTQKANYSDGILNAPRHQLRAVVRTSVSNIAHAAREETYKANEDIVKGVEILATLDTKTCMKCMNWDGKQYPVGEAPSLPGHFSCLPGNSLVLSRHRITAVTKRWYDGEVFIFKTASNRELTCTPNHPILTDQGWLPANGLNIRSHIVCDGGREWKTGLTDVNGQNIPARIEDIAKSFFKSFEMETRPVPLSAEDFHGDGVGSKVAIVSANRFLRDGWNPSFKKHFCENDFIRAYKLFGLIPFPCIRDFLTMFFSMYQALACLMRSLSQFRDYRWRSPIHPGLLLLTAISQSDASCLENPRNRLSGTIELISNSLSTDSFLVKLYNIVFGQREPSRFGWTKTDFGLNQDARDNLIRHAISARNSLYRLASKIRFGDCIRGQIMPIAPDADARTFENGRNGAHADAISLTDILSGKTGPVFLNDVRDIKRRKFAGHVYNLQTQSSFYSAQGIITHNCRCTTVPVLISWKELGIDLEELPASTRASMNGQVAETMTYPAWLKKQSADVQNEALGESRAKMFRSGELELREFIDRQNKPLTLKQLEKML